MLVLDASAAVELLLRRPASRRIELEFDEHGGELAAPHLIDLEVLNALRRAVAAREITPQRSEEALADLLDLPIERYPHAGLAPRIWQLRDNFSAYDAAYVVLTEALDATLLTADARLARAAREHTHARLAEAV